MYRKKYMLALLCTLSVSAVFAGGCANRKKDAKRLTGSASSQTSSESVAVSDAETVSDAVSAAEELVNAPESAVSLAEDAVIWTSSSPESADVLLADSEEDIIIDDSDSTDDIIIDLMTGRMIRERSEKRKRKKSPSMTVRMPIITALPEKKNSLQALLCQERAEQRRLRRKPLSERRKHL